MKEEMEAYLSRMSPELDEKVYGQALWEVSKT